MNEAVLLINQADDGPESRVIVTYHGKARSNCVLPGRFVGYRPNGDLQVEVEHLDPKGYVFKRTVRRISAVDLIRVEFVT